MEREDDGGGAFVRRRTRARDAHASRSHADAHLDGADFHLGRGGKKAVLVRVLVLVLAAVLVLILVQVLVLVFSLSWSWLRFWS